MIGYKYIVGSLHTRVTTHQQRNISPRSIQQQQDNNFETVQNSNPQIASRHFTETEINMFSRKDQKRVQKGKTSLIEVG